VAEALGNESLKILDAAARHADPAEQVRAAMRARIDQRSKRATRRASIR
jgi:regulator of protease activity HflC (stomatin/prohibitin superfamily)